MALPLGLGTIDHTDRPLGRTRLRSEDLPQSEAAVTVPWWVVKPISTASPAYFSRVS
jgi:hypothetical protein